MNTALRVTRYGLPTEYTYQQSPDPEIKIPQGGSLLVPNHTNPSGVQARRTLRRLAPYHAGLDAIAAVPPFLY